MRILHLLRTLLTSDCAAVYPRWPFSKVATDGERIRRFAIAKRFSHQSGLVRATLKAVVCVNWPFRALVSAIRCTRRWGSEIHHRTTKTRFRQFIEQVWFAIRHCVPPKEYYRYELYRSENRHYASQYLHQAEAQSLFRWLNRAANDREVEVIQDKLRFARWCNANNLATIPVLASIQDHRVIFTAGVSAEQAPGSLFLKPATGARGEGVEAWSRTGATFTSSGGFSVSWSELIQHFESKFGDFVLQPMLHNDNRIGDLSGGGLSAVRVVTGRNTDGAVECIAATYKMSWKHRTTNTHGLCSAIDLTTGVLGRAWSYHPVCEGFEAHPDTGAQITARKIPDWQDVLTLARHAHQLLASHPFVGWDIALTTAGLMLLESNAQWDVVSVQQPQRKPLPIATIAGFLPMIDSPPLSLRS